MHHPIDEEDLATAIEKAAGLLSKSTRVAVLTGAGFSAESGVATFRGGGGLWEGHRLEDVATPEGFQRNPKVVWQFYNDRRKGLQQVQPNPGHFALAQLEQHFGRENFTVITQNVDGLHRQAGSTNILEVHGSIQRIRCSSCDYMEDRGTEFMGEMPKCENCGHLLRPDVVWFGEMLPQDVWIKAERATKECDCFLVVGTSAVVFPAAGLIYLARDHDAAVIEINIVRTDASPLVEVGLYGPSGQILPRIVTKLKED